MLQKTIFLFLTLISSLGFTNSWNPLYEYKPCSNKVKKIKKPLNAPQKEFSFDPLTEEEKAAISSFICDLSCKSTEEALKLQKETNGDHSEFRKVYPMITATFILSDPFLYQKVREILQEEKKMAPFLFTLSMSIHQAKEEGRMDRYISEFADLLGVERSVIAFYVDQEKHRDLVEYIFQL